MEKVSSGSQGNSESGTVSLRQRIGLIGGPMLALAVYFLLPESYLDQQGQSIGFSPEGRRIAAIGCWMAFWWMTEAVPVYATALLPIALFPLAGAVSVKQAAAPYGHELIYLFLGGFILALSMQRWGLDKRIAFAALRIIGTRPRPMIFGFMVITAFLSMWVSNTATTLTMLPIALSVIRLLVGENTLSNAASTNIKNEAGERFALCLLLGIAYAASIGGLGTVIGSPPNLFLASFAKEQLGREISFVAWMGIGLPLVAVFLPLTWFLLTRILLPVGEMKVAETGNFAQDAYRELGPMKRGEWATGIVFLLTASAWITRPLLAELTLGGAKPLAGLSDTGIAILAALSLFIIPVDIKKFQFVMDWESAMKLPWGLLILFGGGLSLAAAIEKTGVGEFLGNQVGGLSGIPGVLFVVVVVTLVIFLTELTSNTATAATLIPVFSALAIGMARDPFELIIPVALAASCAFMLPVATPPNAIVYGSGYVPIASMSRAGIWLNVLGVVLITLLTYAVALPLLRM